MRWLLLSRCEDADPEADPSPPRPRRTTPHPPPHRPPPPRSPVLHRWRCPRAPQHLSLPLGSQPPPPPLAPSSPHPEKWNVKKISKFILENGMKMKRLPPLYESRSIDQPKTGPCVSSSLLVSYW
jgi:hypothetical protein